MLPGPIADYGAEVQLMCRLRGQPKQTFVSEVEEAARTQERSDIAQAKLDEAAAMSPNAR